MTTTFFGPKKKVLYVSDGGATYGIWVDADLLAAPFADGLGLNEDTAGTAASPPQRFKPRRVHWQADDGSAKKSIISNPGGTWYESVTRKAATLGGVAGKVTGRTGEKLTY